MIHPILLALALTVAVTDRPTGDDRYPRPLLLVEPAELAKGQTAENFVIVDARDKKKYEAGHIPSARWVDHAAWAKAFQDGKDVAGWTQRIAELGIDGRLPVVIYDDTKNNYAARIWWILRYWGIADVRLLNGGWRAWQEAGLLVTLDAPPTVKPVMLTLKPHAERLATKEHMLDALRKSDEQIVDARSEGEFCGTQKMARRGGAIPQAKRLEWSDLLDSKTQRFKSPDELRQLFRESGIDLTKPSATYCQSGGRASVMAFALELMGVKDVRNYYASWAEWGNAEDTPVEAGKPGK